MAVGISTSVALCMVLSLATVLLCICISRNKKAVVVRKKKVSKNFTVFPKNYYITDRRIAQNPIYDTVGSHIYDCVQAKCEVQPEAPLKATIAPNTLESIEYHESFGCPVSWVSLIQGIHLCLLRRYNICMDH